MPYISPGYLGYISDDQRQHIERAHIPLGYHPETKDVLFVPDNDRYAGMYVLGTAGSGKSGLLGNMVIRDAKAGKGIFMIDMHGDITTDSLGRLPQHRMKDTYLLDMSDWEYPFGINMFSHGRLSNPEDHAQAIARLMHIFEVLWPEVMSQQNLPRYVRAATITFLDNPGATLVDMYGFLLDSTIRQRMLQNVTDPTVRQFWQFQYDDLSEAERNRRVLPLIGRLESLFTGRSLVRNILGQRENTINFRKAIENKEIILIRLPINTVEQDARLIGTIIMSQIQAAIFSFADTPLEKRPGVSLYIDEFQTVSSPDIAKLYAQARKYRVCLAIAHQYRDQLPGYLKEPTMSAYTKVCFRVTPDDAREMASIFPPQEESIKPEDISTNVTEELKLRASDYGPMVEAFVAWYLQPLQKYRRGRGKVEIVHGGFDLLGEVSDMTAGGQMDNPKIDDPTDFLNRLLYDVMRSGNPDQPISWQIPLGFSNSGRGFFAAARNISHKDLTADLLYRLPPHLVIRHMDGSMAWGRLPEGSKEQLYHFLFHLRMVMRYLADHPIGKKSAPSTTVVGQMLTQLPRRAAFVRSGDTVGVIYTQDTPKGASESELQARIQEIQEHTRRTYCRPVKDVEASFMQPVSTDTVQHGVQVTQITPIKRWEEV